MGKSFIHLHLHSEYSLLDSPLKIDPLIKKAQALNMPAIALTDHGNILGAVTFYKAARKNNIKPIIGTELYLTPGSRFDKPDKKKNEINYHHLVALVKNETGYRNLSELISISFTEGFYRKPRIDKEVLKKFKEGLVVLSACIQGEIPSLFLRGRDEEAYAAAKWYRELFKDDFYLEIQKHPIQSQLDVLPKLVQLSKDLSIPLVASNDVHYLNKEDADAREILICLQTNEVLSNPDRAMKKETDQMYFKSTEEMQAVFPELPESLDITWDIAKKCKFDFKLGTMYLPQFKVPEDYIIDGYFEKICRDGFNKIKDSLQGKKHNLQVYEERLTYEIEKIREMGFPGYFLITWDIIKFARDNDIPVGPGRGSVVGSLVAYVMEITGVDPLDYDLIFERFLNPERISMPDIDIDFDGERRDEVIGYIRKKYGKESVAQIVTFGKMKAKLAIRDIGRVLEIPLNDVNKLAKMIPEGPKVELRKEIDSSKDLQKEIRRVPESEKLIDFALKLENTIRHTSMHAAGVVIAPGRLTEFLPLYKTKDDIVTQFEKDEVEEVGLLKMDILGLKTLTIIKNILRELKEIEGKDIQLDKIPLDDEKTYKIFQDGDTDGIFQFESSGMRDYLKRSKPAKIEDLIVLNALYRPGPLGSGMAESYVKRKLGKEKVTYLFPELEEILKDTYGIIVFQEQVMRISQVIAGFSMSKADEMRKIMGKKLTHKLPAVQAEFSEGAGKKKFHKKKAEKLFSQMSTFAEYGFNKSHSTAYALLAYQTAYLKAHFPVYFMSGHLSNEASKTSTSSKVIQYIGECKKMGIEIKSPAINKSFHNFRVETPTSIRFGLKGLKNVGEAAIQGIVAEREKGGPFESYTDFIERVALAKTNKTVLESLIKAGALDCFGIKRRALFDSIEEIIKQAAILEKRKDDKQLSLFSPEEAGAKVVISNGHLKKDEWTEQEIIKGEKEITGIYISHNPLEKYRSEIRKVSNTDIAQIEAGEFNKEVVKLGGVITEVKQIKSKKGTFYGSLFFEDLSGRIKILAFKDKWEKLKDTVKLDFPYFIEGRLPVGDEQNDSIFLENITELEAALKKKARKIVIQVKYEWLSAEFNRKLKARIDANRDSVPYLIIINRPDGQRAGVMSEAGEGLKATVAMKNDFEELTGENTVEILF
ncbi:MAG: DNA polymerase III subunit alpha [Candidatus Aminicenantes bacterium]|nr:DNA polymerase III subunit alpha [Candidatus Aminicenantes bacterium]